jgi:glycosyltransferase involved in cell wall biosynthesis
MLTGSGETPSIVSHGKFFSRFGHKFFFKAMRLEDVGSDLDFNQKLKLRHRLDDLKLAHTTGLVLTEEQAYSILDVVAQAGLYAVVEFKIAAEEIVDRKRFSAANSRIAHAANILHANSALIGFLIDCPMSQDALRAHGIGAVRKRLTALLETLRDRAPHAMLSLKLRPETRALSLLQEDFLYGEIPALPPLEIRDFVVSLHNVAETRPVLIEFAQASPGQDEAVAVAFGTGAAGVVAPPVPAPASHDWLGVRMLRASELMPFVKLNGTCPPRPSTIPMVSVVVCAYNAERTMRPCLESLRKLEYPNYEVVIVDDGSSDATAEISMDFPEFRLIRQANKGLSVARNVGMHAARGEIIAYTDSDCVVDPHWLTLMVRAMEQGGFDGCGGPNLSPHEDGRVEACCAASPGAPCHVLVSDNRAEHLAGCNMVFTKAALAKIGGFDPIFRTAGDDVDICWRLIEAGFRLGFAPAAFVWHFRRNTIKAYYGQQRGYGRAEALLYPRYSDRFNLLGQIAWRGTIPGLARTIPGGSTKRVFWGASNAGSQTLYDPALSMARVLPQTLEWNVFALFAVLGSIALGWTPIPALAMLALGPLWALYYGWHAPLEKCHQSFASRILIAYLCYTGTMVRTITRYKTRAAAIMEKEDTEMVRQRPTINWLKRSINLAYWNEDYTQRENLLDRMLKLFARVGQPVAIDQGWNDYDAELRPNIWTRIEVKTADEEHGGSRITNHVVARVRLSKLSHYALGAGACLVAAAAFAGVPEVALGIAALTIAGSVCLASAMFEAGAAAYRAIENCAAELNLMPMGQPVRAPITVPAGAPVPVPVTSSRQERAAE